MKAQNKKVIILIGPPGSGKGTQGELLSEKLNLYYFEAAKVGEEKINKAKKGEYVIADGKKYYFEKEKKLWQTGKLWSPPFITALVKKKIEELAEAGNSIILSGSPRTLYEGERIAPLLIKLYGKENINIILIEQSAEASIFRNAHRKICELMRHPMLWTKETSKLKNCPLDGSKLLKRKGLDDPETIKIRLKEYKERTYPLIGLFRKQGLKIKKINGEQLVVDVFKDILRVFKF
ncbi:MAG: nucleoside monophosphate kinase [bacterium]|nr:nucleoside monophosphate kinase [bacterium]